MIKTRFNTYFPFLYFLGEFIIILFCSQIMLYLTFTIWSIYNTIFILFWLLTSISFRSHVLGRGIEYFSLVNSTLKSLFFFSGLVAIINLFFFNLQFQLSTLAIAITLFYFSILSYRLILNLVLEKYRAFGGNILRCMIVGYNYHGVHLYEELLKFPEFGYRSFGLFTFDSKVNKNINNIPFQGKIIDLDDSLFKNYDIIFFSEKLSFKEQEYLVQKADEYNLKVNSIPDLVNHDFKNFFISKISSVPYISINKLPLDGFYNQILKRSFDILFSFLVSVFFLSWMIPIFGIIIKLSSKGPVFFIQKREGYKSSFFNCIKFRTMSVNSQSDSKWADDNDSRLTKVGRILRLSALDEMPQFINVLIGDMSVVGPRPHPINLNLEYQDKINKFNKRHRFKPGITGLAQTKGFSGFISELSDMRERVKMDIFYFKNWSIVMDIKIIIMTILKISSNLSFRKN
jgi:putative colanic acid biosysnthesis UDP-glucose lipid carrier transferase